jgi:hypothetical protein
MGESFARKIRTRARTKSVCGVGINDADYVTTIRAMIDGREKTLWSCPFYQTWKEMLRRCYSAKYLSRFPSYAGCEVAPEWHSFSVFREWMERQDWEGKQLDKDALIPGNKVYGPGACVFIPGELNTFLINRTTTRGGWPIGVCLDKAINKFKAVCRNPFIRKNEFLGLFDFPDAAHRAWRDRKHQHACTYADQQADPRIAAALRSRYIEGVKYQ